MVTPAHGAGLRTKFSCVLRVLSYQDNVICCQSRTGLVVVCTTRVILLRRHSTLKATAEQTGCVHCYRGTQTEGCSSTKTQSAERWRWGRLGHAKGEPLRGGCLIILFLFLGKRLLVHQMLQSSRHNWVGHQRDSIRACSRDYRIDLCGILMRMCTD